MKNLVGLLNSFNKISWKKEWHPTDNFKATTTDRQYSFVIVDP